MFQKLYRQNMRPWLQTEEDFACVIGHKGFKNTATFGEHSWKFDACALRCVGVCTHSGQWYDNHCNIALAYICT